MGTVKIEDEDDIQKEWHKLRNAKCAARRKRVLEPYQHQPSNLYDCSTSDLRTIINVGWHARNVIIAMQQERAEVEAYSPTNYHIPLDYLGTTQKRKPEVRNNQPEEREPSTRRNDSRLSKSDAHGTQKASIPPSNVKPFGGPWKLRHSTKTTKKGDGTTRIMMLFIN
jgi:hypothetical protein